MLRHRWPWLSGHLARWPPRQSNRSPHTPDALPFLSYSDHLSSSRKEQLVLRDETHPLAPEPAGPKQHTQTNPREDPRAFTVEDSPWGLGQALPCPQGPLDCFLNNEAHSCHPAEHNDTATEVIPSPRPRARVLQEKARQTPCS